MPKVLYSLPYQSKEGDIMRASRRIFCAGFVVMIVFTNFSMVLFHEGEAEEGENLLTPVVKFLKVNTVIENSYAITSVSEGLENPNEHAIDYDFIFDMPKTAFISNFSLTVDNETKYADILEKETAAEKYDTAVSQGNNAGLVESRGGSTFSYSISLAAGRTTVVGLRYEEYILKDRGKYKYELSLISSAGDLNIEELSINIEIDYITRILSVDVPNYQENSTMKWINDYKVEVSFSEENICPKDNYIVEYRVDKPPLEGQIIKYFDGEESFFFHVFSPGIEDVGALDKEVIFVLDRSGSMGGDKIEQAKETFSGIIHQLPLRDRFNVIFFNGHIDDYSEGLINATNGSKNETINFIYSLEAQGSTDINSALITALNMFEYDGEKAQIIVFLTDGMPTAGITSTDLIRDNVKTANTEQVSIYSLGLGSNVRFEFLEALSLENYGFAQKIYSDKEVGLQIQDFYERISIALLRNLVFSYSEGTYEIYPEHVDYLFEGSECVITGKFTPNLTHIHSQVSAQAGNGTRYFNETFDLEDSGNYSFIPRFWAYNKINHLLDRIVVEGETEELVNEIINLSLEYHFVTPFTSLFLEINETECSIIDSPRSSGDQFIQYGATLYSSSYTYSSASFAVYRTYSISVASPSTGSTSGSTSNTGNSVGVDFSVKSNPVPISSALSGNNLVQDNANDDTENKDNSKLYTNLTTRFCRISEQDIKNVDIDNDIQTEIIQQSLLSEDVDRDSESSIMFKEFDDMDEEAPLSLSSIALFLVFSLFIAIGISYYTFHNGIYQIKNKILRRIITLGEKHF
jgi:uncharacterized protein YegL